MAAGSRRLHQCQSIADLRRLARRRLPWPVWEFLEGGSDDEWSLRNVDAIRNRWARPFALKGLFAVGDAERAAAIGVDALIVSNHGGRQLDAAVAPLDLVAPLARAVGSRVENLVDSGIRRGTDVLKALALGARGFLIGRAYLYGLAAGGEAGVTCALDILREELVRDMTLLGTPELASLDTRVLRAEG